MGDSSFEGGERLHFFFQKRTGSRSSPSGDEAQPWVLLAKDKKLGLVVLEAFRERLTDSEQGAAISSRLRGRRPPTSTARCGADGESHQVDWCRPWAWGPTARVDMSW